MDTYVDAMLKELEFTSRLMKDKKLDTFYMGGGTPTTLEPEQLDRVLSFLRSILTQRVLRNIQLRPADRTA